MARSDKSRQKNGNYQLNLFGGQDQRLRKWIQGLDIPTMAPLEALIELNKLKEELKAGLKK